MTDSSKSYLIYQKELAKCIIFSQEVVKKYIKGYKKFNDKSSLDKIIGSNTKYVRTLAYKELREGFELMDLVAEGTIGLLEAIEEYDESYKNTFLSFAHFKIKGKINMYIDSYSSKVHIPYNVVIGSNQTRRFIANYVAEHGYPPRVEFIADKLKVKVEDIKKELDYINNVKSNKYIDNDFSMTEESISKVLNEYIQLLPEDKQEFINDYFGTLGYYKLSTKDMAKKYNISENTIKTEVNKIIKFFQTLNK